MYNNFSRLVISPGSIRNLCLESATKMHPKITFLVLRWSVTFVKIHNNFGGRREIKAFVIAFTGAVRSQLKDYLYDVSF